MGYDELFKDFKKEIRHSLACIILVMPFWALALYLFKTSLFINEQYILILIISYCASVLSTMANFACCSVFLYDKNDSLSYMLFVTFLSTSVIISGLECFCYYIDRHIAGVTFPIFITSGVAIQILIFLCVFIYKAMTKR